ncbi:hypothetical protein [Enterococcus hirae]|uniref:hypothetical protein n=1 Tax=Enterococcus hirae TaxID=1354 RepID=UPI00136C899F|nr:hypothetical protein [Enterococcus hirae]NAE18224.1 hypothetical protein [Enterococcus hirae]
MNVSYAQSQRLLDAVGPVPVEVVRSKRDGTDIAGTIIISFGFAWLRAWIVMLIAGHFGLHWSYWDALLAVVGVSWLLPSFGNSYMSWTRRPGVKR